MKRTLLSIAMLALVLAQPCGAQTSSPAGGWDLKFIAGPSWPGAQKVKLLIAPDVLTVTAQAKTGQSLKPLTIPMSSVRKIVYTPTTYSRGESFPASGLATGGYPPQGVALYNLGYLTVAAIATGMHGERHFVIVEWEEEGVDQQIMLQAPKETAARIVADLEKVSGPKWMNLEQRAAKVMDEIAQHKDGAFPLQFAAPVTFAKFHLPAGQYQAVLLERDPDSGELYLFAGNTLEPTQLKAVALVDILPPSPGAPGEVKFTSASSSQLAEVHAREKTLKVR